MLYRLVAQTASDHCSCPTFPEIALVVYQYMIEIVIITSSVALYLYHLFFTDIKSEQAITSRSDQQVIVVFLNDIIDTCSLHIGQRNSLEIIISIIIIGQTDTRTNP